MKSFATLLLVAGSQAASLGSYPKTTTTRSSATTYDDFEVTRFRNEPRLTYDTVETDLLRPRENIVVDEVFDTNYRNFDRVLTRKTPRLVVEEFFTDHQLVHAHSSGSEDDSIRSFDHITHSSDGTHSHSLGYTDGLTSDDDIFTDSYSAFSLSQYAYYGVNADVKHHKIAIRERPNYEEERSSDDSSDYHSVESFPLGFGRPRKGKHGFFETDSDRENRLYDISYSSET